MRFWIMTIGGALIALLAGLLPLNILQNFLRRFFPAMMNKHIEYVRMGVVLSGVTILLINAFVSRRIIEELESNIKILEESDYTIRDFDFINIVNQKKGNSIRQRTITLTNRTRFFIEDLEQNRKLKMYLDFLIIGLYNENKPIFYKGIDKDGNFVMSEYDVFEGRLIDIISETDTIDILLDITLYDKKLYSDPEVFNKFIDDAIESIRVGIIINGIFFSGHNIPMSSFKCNVLSIEANFIRCHARFDVSDIYKDKETVRGIYRQRLTQRE